MPIDGAARGLPRCFRRRFWRALRENGTQQSTLGTSGRTASQMRTHGSHRGSAPAEYGGKLVQLSHAPLKRTSESTGTRVKGIHVKRSWGTL